MPHDTRSLATSGAAWAWQHALSAAIILLHTLQTVLRLRVKKKKKRANQKGQTPKGIGRGPLNGDEIKSTEADALRGEGVLKQGTDGRGGQDSGTRGGRTSQGYR